MGSTRHSLTDKKSNECKCQPCLSVVRTSYGTFAILCGRLGRRKEEEKPFIFDRREGCFLCSDKSHVARSEYC
jgi:hypothetical protein